MSDAMGSYSLGPVGPLHCTEIRSKSKILICDKARSYSFNTFDFVFGKILSNLGLRLGQIQGCHISGFIKPHFFGG